MRNRSREQGGRQRGTKAGGWAAGTEAWNARHQPGELSTWAREGEKQTEGGKGEPRRTAEGRAGG